MSVSQFSIVSSLNPFHLRTIPGNFKHYSSKSDRTVSLVRFCDDSHRSFDKRLRNDVSGICFCKSSEESDVDCSDKPTKINLWPILQPWDVPWDWKVAVFVMLPYVMSILLTGIIESEGLSKIPQPHLEGLQAPMLSMDEQGNRFFIDQLFKTVAKLSVMYVFISPYQPFSDNLFSYEWRKPFDLQCGWVLWGGIGLSIASTSVFLTRTLIHGASAGQMQNGAESLLQLLPLIGASNISTACVLGVTGILAPLGEETLYRGFLMTSLTKWLPVPVSVGVSAFIFALCHLSPGKFVEIFIFGIVLGLVYAQTRNLLAPITMHACWNLGVILLLTFLKMQGYDIQSYVL
ncbi:uncharacterized protein LOC18427051 isoform X1 [Amborella trichopoda]|nr:uncharacterized protein LOC18427051 isoform X1 [Amborella trichopoda]|eukprot:XP_020518543.1 uncharacterized protein LOC18427051 isoform X1 [Amborella trichopoda]